MNKENIQNIDLKLSAVKYKDLLTVKTIENNEPIIDVDKQKITYGYQMGMQDMRELIGDRILVRKSVSELLINAQKKLKETNPFYSLFLTYGYRSLEIQEKYFLEQLGKVSLSNYFSNSIDLYEEVHQSIAVPEVAGHPTGGAVDVIIVNSETGESLDFGSKQYDFSSEKCFTFSPDVSKKRMDNRMLLRKVMMQVGFAPYDGEWWHFSYGDRNGNFITKNQTQFTTR